MSMTLLRTMFRRNWRLLLIFIAVLTMYLTVMVAIYDPVDTETLSAMLKLFPEGLMQAMGFSNMVTDLTAFLASWLYGLLMFGFPLVYCVILGNKLVAKMVDDSSFSYLLSTPNSRSKIIITQGCYALASVTLLFATVFAIGVLVSSLMFPQALDIFAFLRLNVTTLLLNLAVIMISFFFSCLFNETRLALSFGAGIPIAFLLMNMLGGASTRLSVLKQISIYGFYDPVELVRGGSALGVNLAYLLIAGTLFTASVLVFNRKQLPL